MAVSIIGGGLEFDATIEDSQFLAQINRMEREINRFSGSVQNHGKDIESFAQKAAAAAAGFLSIQAATGFIQSMVQVRGEFQQIEVAFTTMLKSKAAADELLAESVKLAATTPFTLQDVASGAKQLLAYGFAAKDVTQNLEMLGNIASGVGSQLSDVVYLYGTLRASGRVTQMDINQFAGRGIPIYEALAKVMQINTDQVREYVSAGRIGFPQVEQAFKNLTGPAGQFFNLMQEQSKTLTGQLSNLEDAWSRMLNELGKENEGLFASAIGGAITLVDNYQKVLDILGVLIVTYGAYRAALIAEAALKGVVAARTVGMTAAEILHYNALVLKTKAQAIYNAVLAASPVLLYTAAIAGLGLVIYSLTQAVDAAADTQERLNEVRNSGTIEVNKEQRSIEQLISVLQDHSASVNQKKVAYEKLQVATKGTLAQYSQEEIAAGKAQGTIKEFIKTLREAAQVRKSYSEFNALAEKMDELNTKGVESIGTWRRIGTGFKNAFEIITGDKTAAEVIVSKERESLDMQMNALQKEWGAKWKEVITGVTDDGNKQDVKSVRTEEFIKNEIERIKQLRAPLDIHSNAYKKYTADIKRLNDELTASQGKITSSQKEQNKTREEQVKFLEQLSAKEAEVRRRGLNSDQAAIKEIQDKYAALRKEAKTLKLGPGVVTRIDKLEKSETGDIKFRRDTDFLKEQIEQQRRIFEDFEQYKLDFGNAKAKERYEAELKGFKSFSDYIQSKLALTMAGSVGAPSGAEQERTSLLATTLIESQKKDEARKIEAVKRLHDLTQTLQGKEKELTEQYYKDLALLKEQYTGEELAQREANLAELHRQELDGLKQMAFESSEVGKTMAVDLFYMTRKEIEEQIKKIKELLKTAELTPEQRKSLEGLLDNTKQAFADSNEFAKVASKIADAATQIGGALSQLGDAIGGDTGYTVSQLGNLVGIAGNAAGAAASFATGDIIGGATKAIGVVTSLFTLGKKVKDMNKAARDEVAKFYENAKNGEEAYQALLRKRELDSVARGKTSYQALVAQLEALKKQSPEVQKAYDKIFSSLQGQEFKEGEGYKHGTLFRKAKTWDIMASLGGADYERMEQLYNQGRLKDAALADFEALKKLREELEAAGIKVDELQLQINEMLTGTSVAGLSDALAGLFENGKLAAKDFGDTFENIVGKAILNSFKYSVIEKAMSPLFDQLAGLTEGGRIPGANEVQQFINNATAIGEQLGGQWKAITDGMAGAGLDLFGDKDDKGSSPNSMKGAVERAITEETGSLIVGQFNGLRMTAIEQLSIAKSHLDVALKIEANTLKTATNTEHLSRLAAVETALISIDKKMSNPSNALAAGGVKP